MFEISFLVAVTKANVFFFFAEDGDACVSPNGEKAVCKPINSCDILKGIIRSREQLTVKFLIASQCDYEDEPLVCCGTKKKFDQPPPQPLSLVKGAKPNKGIADKNTCGETVTDNRVVGGSEAGLDEFPWMALLVYENNLGEKSFKCGGSLIGPRYILTAAHCVHRVPETPTKVRLGEWNLNTEKDCYDSEGFDCSDPPVDIDIKEIIPHPSYRHHYHDIALIRLAEPVNYSDFIKPICLPSPMDETKVGENLTVSGWGRTELGTFSPIKMKLNVRKKSRGYCKNIYQQEDIKIIKAQICAGGVAGKDACSGDSGGPLMNFFEDNPLQWYLEGIVSFGKKCGEAGWPGVYTKVSRYLDWIYTNVKSTEEEL